MLPLALLLLLFGCSDRRSLPSQSDHRLQGEQKDIAAQVPNSSQFSVDVQLSEAARKKLIASKETIVVALDFAGHPKQGTEARYLDIKSGDVVLGRVEEEIHPGETAKFNELKLNSDALALIDAHGPNILISVFSGRKSSKDNLLDCEAYDGSLDSVHGRTIEIPCQLIGERSYRDMGIR